MSPREAYLVLNLISGIGPVRVRKLLQYFGDPVSILQSNSSALAKIEGIGPALAEKVSNWEKEVDVKLEISKIRKLGLKLLICEDDNYPQTLKEIHDPPLVLYVWGELKLEDKDAVAIVGSRNCTHYGRKCAQKFGFQLAGAGYSVISGMARGIDTAAHEGALASGGRTIAVLGSGIGKFYPSENYELAKKIVEADQGAIVSEFPVDYTPDRQSFPMRNRIVSGWSSGVLVVEAPGKSGSLITANMAAEQGRSVYAVPGPIDRPASMGVNRLIQDGAKLVVEGSDIVEDLNLLIPTEQTVLPLSEKTAPTNCSEEEKIIYDVMKDLEEVSIDELASSCDIGVSDISAILMTLEMKKMVKALPGARYVRLV